MAATRNTPKETATSASTTTAGTSVAGISAEKVTSSWPENCLWPELYRQNDLPPTLDLDEIVTAHSI